MATWVWASRRIEEEFLRRCVDHCNIVASVVEAMERMIEAIERNDLENARKLYEKAFEEERRADDVKKSILGEMSRSSIHPMDREYLLRLVLRMDDVAAYAKAAARRLLISIDVGIELGKELLKFIKEMGSRIGDASRTLCRAIEALSTSPSRALELSDEVERREEEVDEVRMQALEYIFRESRSGTRSITWSMIAKDLIDTLEAASDRAEDTADMIRLIAVSLT